jgi:hypothetical protein
LLNRGSGTSDAGASGRRDDNYLASAWQEINGPIIDAATIDKTDRGGEDNRPERRSRGYQARHCAAEIAPPQPSSS